MSLTITARYPAPGQGPAGLAWDGELLWNADRRAGAILGLSTDTGAVTRTLFSPGNLGGLAWDGRSLWQAVYDESLLRRIDSQTNDFDQTIMLPEDDWLPGLAWDGHLLWALAQRQGRLLAVDPISGAVSRSVEVPVAGGDLDVHNGSIWLSLAAPMVYDETEGGFDWQGAPRFSIIQINPANGRVLAEHPAEGLYTGLAWAGDELWLASAATREILRASID